MPWIISALGSNGSGQLGIGHLEDVSAPTPCLFDAQPPPSRKPVSVAAGGNHTLLLFDDGAVYASGDSSNLSMAPSMAGASTFKRIFFDDDGTTVDRFRHIACTWASSVLVSLGGAVYTAGAGSWGELGCGDGTTSLQRPQKLAAFPPPGLSVTSIAACMSHAAAILSDGSVWGWGNGRKGQLGEPKGLVWEPRPIAEGPAGAVEVLCTKDATVILNTQRAVAVLGADKWALQSSAPSAVRDWVQAGANWGTVTVLQKDGTAVSWGRNDHQQLVPDQLAGLMTIACGSEHTIARTRDGKIIAWGWGEHGNCALPLNARKDTEPFNVLSEDPRCEVFGAGCATSFIVSQG